MFAIEPDKLTVVALDGYRLAIIEKPVKAAKEISIIIPAKTLSEVVKLFGEDDEVVHVAANRRFVVFSTRTYTVISRLIEGDFLDYKRVIPEGYQNPRYGGCARFCQHPSSAPALSSPSV